MWLRSRRPNLIVATSGCFLRLGRADHLEPSTTATLLLDAGVDITEVQALLGHKHVTVTQVYDKRRRTTRESASHKVPL